MNPKLAKVNHLSLVSPVQLGLGDSVLGTVFRKQIVSYGKWINPDYWWGFGDEDLWMNLDEAFADSLIANFTAKTFGKRISVPLNHTGDVTANVGEVIKLEKGDGGLWAYLDVRDQGAIDKLNEGLIFDVSIGFDWDYTDQKTGDTFGPTLIHVALVTDPYLNDMDDFAKVDNVELSRRHTSWSNNIGFGKETESIILMSKSKVEEKLHMLKFSKVSNDKEYPVEVTYKDADGKEVKQTIEAGAEIEVPTDSEDAVKALIADSTAPEEEETDEERTAREEQEEADRKTAEEEEKTKTEEQKELARLRAKNAEYEADALYAKLLSKSRITPGQKELFKEFAKATAKQTVTLSKDFKDMKLSKGQTTSMITMLSAILEAGPDLVKFGEKGNGGDGDEAELSTEDKARAKRMGFSPERIQKQLEKDKLKKDEDN